MARACGQGVATERVRDRRMDTETFRSRWFPVVLLQPAYAWDEPAWITAYRHAALPATVKDSSWDPCQRTRRAVLPGRDPLLNLESRGADHDKGKRRMAPSEHGIDSPGTLDGHRTLGFVSAALNSGPLASGEMT